MEEQEIIDKYMDILVSDLKQQYEEIGLKASGGLGESFRSSANIRYGKITIDVLSNDYSQYLIEPGRSASKVPFDAILNWVKVKPNVPPNGFTDESFAWAVVTNIEKLGVKVPNNFNPGTLFQPIEDFRVNHQSDMVRDLGEFRLIRAVENYRLFLRNSKLSNDTPTNSNRRRRTRPARRRRRATRR